MTSVLADIADAVVEELNSQAWSQTFRAVRKNIPRHKREEMSNLHVTVSPKSMSTTPVTRSNFYRNIEVYVGIEKGLAGDTNGESDDLISLGEEIADYFANGRSLATYDGAPCVSSVFGNGDGSPWMDIKKDNEDLLYRGVVVLEFQTLGTVS